MRCSRCGANAYEGSKNSLCPACHRAERKQKGARRRAILAIATVVVILGGVAFLVTYLFFGSPHGKPGKSPSEIAAELERTEAMSPARTSADTNQNRPDDAASGMSIEGQTAYREWLHPDSARPPIKQIEAWAAAFHYTVLHLDREPGSSCAEDVELAKSVDQSQVNTIADSIRQHECAGIVPIVLNFYIKGAKKDQRPWAEASLQPSVTDSQPQFAISFPSSEPQSGASASQPVGNAGEEVLGSWRDPSDGFTARILKENGQFYEEFSMKNADHPARGALEEASSPLGRKFVVAGSDVGEYYIVAPDGSLKRYFRTGYAKTIPQAPK